MIPYTYLSSYDRIKQVKNLQYIAVFVVL
ncbi:MAG: hypothetical protein ACI90V_013519, partial [Bacillariaceae sp.]